MINLQKINQIPSMVKVEDGYSYPEKYLNKAFMYEDTLIFFQDKKYLQFPLQTIVNILDSFNFTNQDQVSESIKEENEALFELFEGKIKKIEDKFHDLGQSIQNVTESISNISSRINEIEKNLNSMQSVEGIHDVMDKKLQDVYANFQKVSKQITDEAIQSQIEVLKTSANKLKPTTVMLYKEMGMNIQEIAELAKQGLI